LSAVAPCRDDGFPTREAVTCVFAGCYSRSTSPRPDLGVPALVFRPERAASALLRLPASPVPSPIHTGAALDRKRRGLRSDLKGLLCSEATQT
jgi:hypothetical protein